jgi:hypothetical protein
MVNVEQFLLSTFEPENSRGNTELENLPSNLAEYKDSDGCQPGQADIGRLIILPSCSPTRRARPTARDQSKYVVDQLGDNGREMRRVYPKFYAIDCVTQFWSMSADVAGPAGVLPSEKAMPGGCDHCWFSGLQKGEKSGMFVADLGPDCIWLGR